MSSVLQYMSVQTPSRRSSVSIQTNVARQEHRDPLVVQIDVKQPPVPTAADEPPLRPLERPPLASTNTTPCRSARTQMSNIITPMSSIPRSSRNESMIIYDAPHPCNDCVNKQLSRDRRREHDKSEARERSIDNTMLTSCIPQESDSTHQSAKRAKFQQEAAAHLETRRREKAERLAAEKRLSFQELEFLRQKDEIDARKERSMSERRRNEALQMQAQARDAILRKKEESARRRNEPPSFGMQFDEYRSDSRPRPGSSSADLSKSWKDQISERKRRKDEEHSYMHEPSDEPFGKEDAARGEGVAQRRMLLLSLQTQIRDRQQRRIADREARHRDVNYGMEFGSEGDPRCMFRCPVNGKVLPPEAFNLPRRR
eukprot:Tbor_TRINITY_DN4983_c0_g1::TRINITY_DN4983_c0_g1_i2::g.10006::m.10006